MSAAPAISVIVPTHGGRERVLALLAALERADAPPDSFEAIVAVDGDVDGTRDAVVAHASSFAVQAVVQAGAGRAAACNLGLGAARGALVLILDDDMEPRPGCLPAHLARHAALAAPAAVVGDVPVRVPADAGVATRYVARRFAEHGAALASGRPFGPRDFYSGHVSLPRATLVAVGGFDAAYRRYGNEDVDLFLRLRRAGVDVVFAPEAVADQSYLKDAATLVRDGHAKGWTVIQLVAAHPEAAAGTRLASWGTGGLRRRLLRRLGLAVDVVAPALLARAARALAWADRRGRLPVAVLDLAADVAFWTGVRRALAAESGRRAGPRAVAVRARRAVAAA